MYLIFKILKKAIWLTIILKIHSVQFHSPNYHIKPLISIFLNNLDETAIASKVLKYINTSIYYQLL